MKSPIKISFLVTHFNRPAALKSCIESIKKLSLANYEIVVSDDGSAAENQKMIKDLAIDKLLIAANNVGLASNLNKGILACSGEYIVYCQKDFNLNADFKYVLPRCVELLENNKADMIRLMAYFEFNKLIPLSEEINLIPKFSFHNFYQNFYQYSDHPFIVKKSFFNTFGYYLEKTSGDYGETEYAIRIMKSKAKIAIIAYKYINSIAGTESVIDRPVNKSIFIKVSTKSVYKLARALRLYLECILYSKSKRGLVTYTNYRKVKTKE
jgi:glycosyltransferase involved in cell wall biosynthesis